MMHKKIFISMFWKESDDPASSPMVYFSGDPKSWPEGAVELLNLCNENPAYRQVGDDWIFCPGMFPLHSNFDSDDSKKYYENHANLAENLPENLERERVGHVYEIEINDGVMSIYCDLYKDMKINISLEDFKLFHKNYTYVRTTKKPTNFSVTIW